MASLDFGLTSYWFWDLLSVVGLCFAVLDLDTDECQYTIQSRFSSSNKLTLIHINNQNACSWYGNRQDGLFNQVKVSVLLVCGYIDIRKMIPTFNLCNDASTLQFLCGTELQAGGKIMLKLHLKGHESPNIRQSWFAMWHLLNLEDFCLLTQTR